MKNIFVATLFLFFLAFGFSSCEDCKDCRAVVYYDDGTLAEDNFTPEEYCGQDLEDVVSEDTVTMGNDRYSIWVCE